MAAKIVSINRGPALTFWTAVIAERLAFAEDEGLSLGKALAGTSKVRRRYEARSTDRSAGSSAAVGLYRRGKHGH
jgi:hypothetical protein